MADDHRQALRVRPTLEEDFAQWRELYRAYAEFYGVSQSDAMARQVWSWISDAEHEVHALVVENESGDLVGLAHYRPFARPLSATTGCYLDDLFVDPIQRGAGAADLLLHELARSAGQEWVERRALDHC